MIVSCSTWAEKFNLEIHALPAGTSLVIACTPLSNEVGANLPGGCLSATGTPFAAPYSLDAAGESWLPYVGGAVTVGSTGGTLQIDIACTANCGSVMVKTGSFMVLQQVS